MKWVACNILRASNLWDIATDYPALISNKNCFTVIIILRMESCDSEHTSFSAFGILTLVTVNLLQLFRTIFKVFFSVKGDFSKVFSHVNHMAQ